MCCLQLAPLQIVSAPDGETKQILARLKTEHCFQVSFVFLRPGGAWRMPPKGGWAQKEHELANELWCLIMQPLCTKGSTRWSHKPQPALGTSQQRQLGGGGGAQEVPVRVRGTCRITLILSTLQMLSWVGATPIPWLLSPAWSVGEHDDELAAFFRTLWNEIYPVLQTRWSRHNKVFLFSRGDMNT